MAGNTVKDISAAEELLEAGFSLDGLDAINDAQRLIGPVIGYMILLKTAVGATDLEERRKAAQALIKEVDEDPDEIADRIRQSAFKDLDLEDLKMVVATGELDLEKAAEKYKEQKED